MTVGTKTEENEELIKDNHDWEDEDSVVRNLTCILVTGIQDPVRDEVSDTLPTPKHTLSPPPPLLTCPNPHPYSHLNPQWSYPDLYPGHQHPGPIHTRGQ